MTWDQSAEKEQTGIRVSADSSCCIVIWLPKRATVAVTSSRGNVSWVKTLHGKGTERNYNANKVEQTGQLGDSTCYVELNMELCLNM